MGSFEYVENAIPISRMFIEYFKDSYLFFKTNIFSVTGEEMYIYGNGDIISKKIKDNADFRTKANKLKFIAPKSHDFGFSAS